jgi:cytochrome c peroxidase
MVRYVLLLSAMVIVVLFFSFSIKPDITPSQKVKNSYLAGLDTFINELKALQVVVDSGNKNQIQTQFLLSRYSYKKIEPVIEYYFDSYAINLNGPPIPFFEENEPYKLETEPLGMQVIEVAIFPEYELKNKPVLQYQLDEMLRHAIELSNIKEDIEFNDATIFDAFIEEVYRITALGITGFDSQTAQNALPECAASLKGLQHFISFYQLQIDEKMPAKYQQLDQLFTDAVLYLKKNNGFNSFDRLTFITRYLNPIAKIIGEYKTVNNMGDNKSGYYYSLIQKNNTLFNPGAFNAFRFIDDFTTTPQKVEFGRQLFFEKQLSVNNKQSCSGCHQPNKAFTDGLKTSAALDGHTILKRNAPTLWNAALQRSLFVDNRSRSLEDQVLQVLNNSKEMHGSAKAVAAKILNIAKYKDLYNGAYPLAKEEDAVTNICNAIACFERTLIALNSKFDKHMNGRTVLNKTEMNGFNLFMGKAKCGTCHFMPLFSGAKPPRYYFIESEVLGVPATANKKQPQLDSDSGRYLVTKSPVHLFSFKTTSLRNVALTAPYMHNGVFKTLEEVVDFYNNGGGQGLGIAPPNQTLPFEKLNLTKKEKKDLIFFMNTLTDTTPVYRSSD